MLIMSYHVYMFYHLVMTLPVRHGKSTHFIARSWGCDGTGSEKKGPLVNYPLINVVNVVNKKRWKDPPFLIAKQSINGPFSIAMLNYQRVPWITI